MVTRLTPLDHLDLAWGMMRRRRHPVESLMRFARRAVESGADEHDTLMLHLVAATDEMSLGQIRGYLQKREEMDRL